MHIFYTVLLATLTSSCTQAYWQTSSSERAKIEMNEALEEDGSKYEHGMASAALAFVTLGMAGDGEYEKIRKAEMERDKAEADAKAEKLGLKSSTLPEDGLEQELEEDFPEEQDSFDTGEDEPNYFERMSDRWSSEDEFETAVKGGDKLDQFVIGETTYEQVKKVLGAPVYMFQKPEMGIEARFTLYEYVGFLSRFRDNEDVFVKMKFDVDGLLKSMVSD